MLHTVQKFADPFVTATGAPRASIGFGVFETLWFNTGTLCNLARDNCYIESSPRNDRLVYLTRAEVQRFLDEAKELGDPPSEIGFIGGEPFMNPGSRRREIALVRGALRALACARYCGLIRMRRTWPAPRCVVDRAHQEDIVALVIQGVSVTCPLGVA
jgi:hypothetical protein